MVTRVLIRDKQGKKAGLSEADLNTPTQSSWATPRKHPKSSKSWNMPLG